ncbi:MAG: DUF4349 domain-containing protein [Myxococcales bacterium]|nr:DUF4349 domain-containing protein [Myxococcales bacterium]MCB9551198.1 DUF4349 domain-containing protein [Myxococcales bacterium]
MRRIRPFAPLLAAPLLAALLVACGGAPAQHAPMMMPADVAAGSASSYFSKSAEAPKLYSEPAPSKDIAIAEPDAKGMTARQVVYLGFLRLRVRRLLDAVDALTARVEAAGGYVESLSKTVMVVRIPGGDFDAAMNRLAEVGDVLARQVKALDVTAQFLDLEGRLAVAHRTRDRLLALLETARDTDERLRILQEIKRLTEQIESMSSRLATLQNLVAYYTITIELEPVTAENRVVVHRSPFPWIRRMAAHHEALPETDDAALPVPAGFVRIESADGWQARASDTSVLRISEVDNEPRGDAAWWAAAIRHELEGRDEEITAAGAAGGLHWMIAREKDVEPRGWLVGVATKGDDVFVVEGFFPDPAALDRHRAAVLAALDGFRAE